MLTIDAINSLPLDDAAAALASVIENSPWVVRAALEDRPFASVARLHDAMMTVAGNAPLEIRLALLRAHPELAGSSVPVAEMTADSQAEQGTAGLDSLPDSERAAFDELNRAYRERFTFPFIIAVREHNRDSILAAFRQRLGNTAEVEMAIALGEMAKVSRARLHRLVSDR
jgi:2-oxo-4-hydroxy-4-carboxy-5-ureidoimidazoline decarboxylase